MCTKSSFYQCRTEDFLGFVQHITSVCRPAVVINEGLCNSHSLYRLRGTFVRYFREMHLTPARLQRRHGERLFNILRCHHTKQRFVLIRNSGRDAFRPIELERNGMECHSILSNIIGPSTCCNQVCMDGMLTQPPSRRDGWEMTGPTLVDLLALSGLLLPNGGYTAFAVFIVPLLWLVLSAQPSDCRR